MAKTKIPSNDLNELMKIRYEIQMFNLKSYIYIEKNETELRTGKFNFQFDLLQNLIGSNFSLWRFAFLIYENVDESSKITALKNFLHYLIMDNTMSFPREVETQEWLGGYYGNNSRQKLIRFITKAQKIDEADIAEVCGALEFCDEERSIYGLDQMRELPMTMKKNVEKLLYQFHLQNELFSWFQRYSEIKGLKLPKYPTSLSSGP